MSVDIVNEIRVMTAHGGHLHDIIIAIHEFYNTEPYQRGIVMLPLRQAFGLELRALMDHILSCEIFGDGTTSVQQLELWFDSQRRSLLHGR